MKRWLAVLVSGLVLAAAQPSDGRGGGGHSGGSHSGSHSGGSHSGSHSGGSHSGSHSGGSHSSSGHSHARSGPKSHLARSYHYQTHAPGARDSHGRLVRSEFAKREFMRETGYPHGRPGYVVDHVVPLK